MMLRRLIAAAALALVVSHGAAAQEGQVFAEPGHGYTLSYPPGWTVTSPSDYAVILRPPLDAAGGPVAVSVENVRLPDDAGPMEGIDVLAERYLSELREQAQAVEIHRQAPFRWEAAEGPALVGRQVVADFTRDGLPYRQWAVFLPSPIGPVAHVWLYTAPESLFDEWRPTAEVILRSLQPARQ